MSICDFYYILLNIKKNSIFHAAYVEEIMKIDQSFSIILLPRFFISGIVSGIHLFSLPLYTINAKSRAGTP
ncbi:hypothetical protein KM92DES2_12620 [uncultured Desulfovibrio sp.]|uniref:Uncharacterized protein n=1 Tax=uncultured Desulfovibrio sp. TaxID=167968 RepID=A0A212KBQ5_9BACT|nr:hypothetical protein KM92DES2_12620 [uncultured Desulfovibrio sp.]